MKRHDKRHGLRHGQSARIPAWPKNPRHIRRHATGTKTTGLSARSVTPLERGYGVANPAAQDEGISTLNGIGRPRDGETA